MRIVRIICLVTFLTTLLFSIISFAVLPSEEIVDEGEFGYIDKKGNLAITQQFANAGDFEDNKAIVVNENTNKSELAWNQKKYGNIYKKYTNLYTRTGTYKDLDIGLSYNIQGTTNYDTGISRIIEKASELNSNWFYIDKCGKKLGSLNINKKLYGFNDFYEELAVVSERPVLSGPELISYFPDEKWGFIHSNGDWVIKPQFIRARNFSNGLAAVAIRGANNEVKWGFINKKGELIIEPQYRLVGDFSDGLAAVQLFDKSELWGYIDKTGKKVIMPQFDSVGNFSEGLAAVSIPKKKSENGTFVLIDGQVIYTDINFWGYINKKGKIIISPQFLWTTTGEFHEGLACVKIDGKWGYIDNKGKVIIQPKYDSAGNFSEGLANIKIQEKWGYIDKTGNKVIEPKYMRAYNFKNGLARISNVKYQRIDDSGSQDTMDNTDYMLKSKIAVAIIFLVTFIVLAIVINSKLKKRIITKE